MKKGLMLSLAASAVLFAGGDIAPVEPVAEAPAAACDDFYGFAGAGVIYGDPDVGTDNDEVATYGAVALLGVNKEIVSGLTVNAELQGGVFQEYIAEDDDRGPIMEFGALTQLNLGYTWCNTAFKVGRMAVPGSLSPLHYSGTDYFGLKNSTFEGALVANTDLPDTTIWAAYVRTILTHATTDNLDVLRDQGKSKRTGVSLAAAGLVNKSFADTVITLAGYYDLTGDDTKDDRALPFTYEIAGSIDKKWCDTDISIGAAYRTYDAKSFVNSNGDTITTGDYDYMVGAYVVQHFGKVDAMFAATYVADEDSADDDFARSAGFYNKYVLKTMHGYLNREGWSIGGSLSTDWCGYKLSAYGMYDQQGDYQAGTGVKKTIAGITFGIDYRYRHHVGDDIDSDQDDKNSQRLRASAIYNF